jgi:hypothetical protein
VTTWQTLRQLAYLLAAATWPDAPSEKVLGSARAALVGEDLAAANLRAGAHALVRPGAYDADPDEPRLLRQELEVVLAVRSEGDPFGERALIGGPRSGGQGSSGGRGLLEVEEPALAAVDRLTQTTGVRPVVRRASGTVATPVAGSAWLASRVHKVEAIVTRDRYYHPPTKLRATAAGGGAVSLTWALPPDRWDRRRVVLRRAAGATAPSSASAGTSVTLSGSLATSVTDSPGVGTWSYAMFAAYDETGSATDERWSAQERNTTATVVAT